MRDDLPRPQYSELIAVVVLGAGHVVVELALSLTAARIYSGVALTLGAAYLGWRAATTKGILYRWGLRRDNFWIALLHHCFFLVTATVGLLSWASFSGRLVFPSTLWVVLLLYNVFIGAVTALAPIRWLAEEAEFAGPAACTAVGAALASYHIWNRYPVRPGKVARG